MTALSSKNEIRNSEDATAFFSAGACLVRLGKSGEPELLPLARRILALLSEAGALPPPGVVADIAHLALGGSFELPRTAPSGDALISDTIRLYEDRFLARLADDPRLTAAVDAIAKLPPELRDAAIAVFSARILARIEFTYALAMSPAVARRAAEASARDLFERGHTLLRGGGKVVVQLLDGYDALIDAARRAPLLISEADVFLLESFHVLGDLGVRLALEQALEAAEQLAATLPRRMKPRPGVRRGLSPTRIAEEDHYPIGGFSSIATSGSLENLVTSELIYMDEVRSAEDIDLFDLRFVEGDLLYFMRDESVFLRRRRQLVFALEGDLSRARVRDAEAPWQRAVMALGAVACITRKCTEWLHEEDLAVRLLFYRTGKQPELGLATLLLREWIEKGIAEVAEVEELDLSTVMPLELNAAKTFDEWAAWTRDTLQQIIDG